MPHRSMQTLDITMMAIGLMNLKGVLQKIPDLCGSIHIPMVLGGQTLEAFVGKQVINTFDYTGYITNAKLMDTTFIIRAIFF